MSNSSGGGRNVLIEAVLDLDRRVRYVAMFGEDLRLIAASMQEGTLPYSPKFIDEVVMPILVGVLKRLTEYAGELDHCTISYEKVKIIIYRRMEGFMVVSLEPGVDMSGFYGRLAKMHNEGKA